MKLNLGSKSVEMSANQKAIAGLAKFLSACIIVAVVAFCEIMYLGMVSVAFPDGLFRSLASLGAIAGGLSVLTLLLGKMYWFPEGGQEIASWAFTAVEIVVLVANVLLAFQLKTGHVDTYLAYWQAFSPASPVIALVGWVAMWMLDGSTKSRHAQLAQEQKEHESRLHFQSSVHEAQMELQHTMLDSHTQYLMEYANSTELQNEIRDAAKKLARQNLSVLSGINIVARLGNPTNTVDSTLASASLAQTGSIASPENVGTSEPDEQDNEDGKIGRKHRDARVQEMLEEWNATGDVPTLWDTPHMRSRMRNKYGSQYPGIMPDDEQ